MESPVGFVDALAGFVADNPVVVGIVVLLLAFVFFAYLMVRRTLLGLKEGYESGRRGE